MKTFAYFDIPQPVPEIPNPGNPIQMSIKLLTPPENYAICKMDERNFPGIVFQGDSFSSLLKILKRTHKSMIEKFPIELDDEIVELKDQIDLYDKVLLRYERVCRENGFGLPYVK